MNSIESLWVVISVRKTVKVAWGLSASLEADYKGVHGSLPNGVIMWPSLRIPSDSYVWYLVVKPISPNDLAVPLDGMKEVMN